eukprot:Awhi_evm1s13481
MSVSDQEVKEQFNTFDLDGDGKIDVDEICEVLKSCQLSTPKYEVRTMLQEYDTDNDGKLDFDEFQQIFTSIKGKKDAGFSKVVKDVAGVNKMKSTGPQAAEGTTHSFSEDEKLAFVDWINYALGDDPELKHLLPLKEDGNHLFECCHDGLLLSKLINSSVPETIDERALNKTKLSIFKVSENQTLCINSAKAIGCNITNIGPSDIIAGSPHLCLGMIWQIIRIGLLARINLSACPGLARLLEGDETLEDLLALPADQILLRWVNYHLAEAGSSRRINNFSGDIKDSECYTILLKQIAPRHLNIDDSPLAENDPTKRADLMLDNAEKMECRRFVKPRDVVKGNPKLNLAFVANLFNTHPALEPMEEIEIIEETREEKTFRNWMNSLGVNPYVNNLYQDLRDGIVILQLFDKVYPGIVDWKGRPVTMPPFKKIGGNMKKLENCNYAIELGLGKKFSLVGIDGKDIYDGQKMLTLAIIWQLMRQYTLEILKRLSGSDKPITDADIVDWANQTLAAGGKDSKITSFKDKSITTSLPVIDLVDCIKPGSIDYSIIIQSPKNEKDRMNNAKYAISMARKIGAGVYALPEDLAEGNPKMVMTAFASLMSQSMEK